MSDIAKAETLLKYAARRTAATIKKRDNRSRNTFVAWTVNKLLETYKDPRAILLEIASTDTRKLAADMNGTFADALAERRLCAQAVLPYVAQKLPVQVDMRHTKAIHLNIVDDRQYQELVEIADTPTDDGFSMQLIAASPAVETSTAEGQETHASDTPATLHGEPDATPAQETTHDVQGSDDTKGSGDGAQPKPAMD